MKKNQSVAAARRVGPIPFFDNDGNRVSGLTFKTADGQVFTEGDGAAYAAAAADIVEISRGSYYYVFSQAETNFSAFISVMLSRPGLTGTSTATAANSLTDSALTMATNAFAGQTLVDSAAARWPIVSNTSTVFTLGGSGTPASGAFVVEAFKDMEWSERIDGDVNVVSVADGAITIESVDDGLLELLGVDVVDLESGGAFSRTSVQLDFASTSSVNDFYTGGMLYVVSGTGAGGWATVDAYTNGGGEHVASLAGAGLPVAPDEDSVCAIIRSPRYFPGDAVMDLLDGPSSIIEGSATLGDMVRLMASMTAGPVTDFRTGLLVFKSLDGSKTRLTGTTDASGRISIVIGDLT